MNHKSKMCMYMFHNTPLFISRSQWTLHCRQKTQQETQFRNSSTSCRHHHQSNGTPDSRSVGPSQGSLWRILVRSEEGDLWAWRHLPLDSALLLLPLACPSEDDPQRPSGRQFNHWVTSWWWIRAIQSRGEVQAVEKRTSEPLLYSLCLPASVCESAVQQTKNCQTCSFFHCLGLVRFY